MQISMYDFSVPVLNLALGNLKHIISKGAAHCSEHGIDAVSYTHLTLPTIYAV